jgi:hypothetical protein
VICKLSNQLFAMFYARREADCLAVPTKDILAEMPKTEGRFLSVRKILETGE